MRVYNLDRVAKARLVTRSASHLVETVLQLRSKTNGANQSRLHASGALVEQWEHVVQVFLSQNDVVCCHELSCLHSMRGQSTFVNKNMKNCMHGNFPCSHVLTGCEFVWNRRLQGIDLHMDFKSASNLRRLWCFNPNGCPASSYDARILMSSQNHSTCIECILSLSVCLSTLLYSTHSFVCWGRIKVTVMSTKLLSVTSCDIFFRKTSAKDLH